MKKISKLTAVLLVITLTGILFAGCGESKTTSAGSSTTSTSSDGSANAGIDPDVLGKFEFSFTCHDPDTALKIMYMQQLCDEVYEKTNGGVHITIYPSGTLVAGTDCATAIEDGTADMGWLYTGFFPGEFIYSEIVCLPMTYESSVQANEVLLDLMESNDLVKEELSRYHILAASTNPMNHIYTNKEIDGIESFAGQNWRAAAGAATDLAKLLGATPVLMGSSDIYESLEKNVLDGYIFEGSGVNSFNLQECTKYYLDVDIFCGIILIPMNLDAWNSLPTEYQEIMTEVWSAGSLGQTELLVQEVEDIKPDFEAAGLTAVKADDEMLNDIQEACQAYVEYYIDTYACEDLYEEALNLAAKH